MSYPVIKVSEIPDYVYCRRAWWLKRVANEKSGNQAEMKVGRAYHQMHGREVGRSIWYARLAIILIFVAVSIITYWLVS